MRLGIETRSVAVTVALQIVARYSWSRRVLFDYLGGEKGQIWGMRIVGNADLDEVGAPVAVCLFDH